VGSLGTDGQVFTSSGAGKSAVYEAAAGGANSPMFSARSTGMFGISSLVFTKVNFGDANWSVGGTYDTTNYRWTPGTAGKYVLMAWVGLYSVGVDDMYVEIQFWKNGAFNADPNGDADLGATRFVENERISDVTQSFFNSSIVVDDGNDYWECYVKHGYPSTVNLWNNGHYTNFCGFKLIE
jgi:hypothetical protein